MPPREKSLKALSRVVSSLSRSESVCLSCRRTLHLQRQIQHRQYASTAAAAAEAELPVSPPSPFASPSKTDDISPKTPSIRPAYQLHAGIVLSRAPTLTRDLTPFEKAYYLYQRRLNERLAIPFTRYFYFQKGTPPDLEWKRKMRERLTPARDIGVYNAYSAEGWNDELLIGDKISEPDHQVEALLRDAASPDAVAAEGLVVQPELGDERTEKAMAEEKVVQAAGKKEEIERPVGRMTEADRSGDEQSLDRAGWRTLYLLVKENSGRWRFPSARLIGKESLHKAAERVIVQAGGPNMNTWVVGNSPVGHYAIDFHNPILNAETRTHELGEKIFFLKGRIMAGQANLKENKLDLVDFKWLAKEEIKSHVDTRYYSMVENMLVER